MEQVEHVHEINGGTRCGDVLRETCTRRCGFTLVEISIAAFIFAVAMGTAGIYVHHVIASYTIVADARVARERCARVEALLSLPLMNCGYGVPSHPESFKKSFGTLNMAPFNWPGPFSTYDDVRFGAKDPYENAAVRIVYVVSTGARCADAVTSRGSDGFTVRFDKQPSRIAVKDSVKPALDSWCVFGAMSPDSAPIRIYGVNTSKITVTFKVEPETDPSVERTILRNDELYVLAALDVRIGLSDGEPALVTNDYLGGGFQPRVRGVTDIRFELDRSRSLVVLYVLARGATRHAETVSRGSIENWPAKFEGDLSEEDRHYVLRATRSSWLLRDVGDAL